MAIGEYHFFYRITYVVVVTAEQLQISNSCGAVFSSREVGCFVHKVAMLYLECAQGG